ncbi:MAG: hypothetical protein R2867_11990 [Caldilineaceae bacterium]
MSIRLLTLDGAFVTLDHETMTAFRQSFSGPVLPGDPDYDEVRRAWEQDA